MTGLAWLLAALLASGDDLATRNAALLAEIESEHRLDPQAAEEIARIFRSTRWIGQGNPAISRPAMTDETCLERWNAAEVDVPAERWEEICGRPWMAPLYDPSTEAPEDARACIDRWEFPGLPCRRPVVWVRARDAAELCRAMGKRLCDAHEWEGACAGALTEPDYRFDLASGKTTADAVGAMRKAHNAAESGRRSWSYGDAARDGICATGSRKSAECGGGEWSACGSNTYPAGAFPECRSPLGVDDLHGNAAEHMNLPLAPGQMSGGGSGELGVTEMKGSWFIWDSYRAHDDWCRWRAPFWHGSRVMDPSSHHNYHLGFRCCSTVDSREPDGDGGEISGSERPPAGAPAPPGSVPRR